MRNLLLILALASAASAQTVTIGACAFAGSGLNDATCGGHFSTAPGNHSYVVTISATGTPDHFTWTKDGGSASSPVALTGSAQTLSDGVTITFAATAGHTLANSWTITATASGSASASSFIHRLVGAVFRTTQDKLRDTLSVKDFGAVGNGIADDGPAISAALAAACSIAGEHVFVPRGTYKSASGTLPVCSGVTLAGPGSGAPAYIQATGAFPAITLLNTINSSVQNLKVSSVQDAILISNTSAGNPTQYPLIQNVTVSSFGSAYAGIHVTNSQCCVYWPTFLNVNINGSVSAPGAVGSGYRFDYSGSGSTGYNLRPIIIGGRVTNAKYGLEVSSADHLTVIGGTAFDGIQTGSSTGIAIWLKTGISNAFIEQPRLEGDGTGTSIDKDVQLDSGSVYNQVDLDKGYSGAPSRVTDAGSNNCVSGGNGSGGLTPYCMLPQITGDLQVASGHVLSLPGTTTNQFTVNGGLTSDQLAGVGCLMCVKGPNSNFGYAYALMADSVGRGFALVTQGFSAVGMTGSILAFSPSTGVSYAGSGGSASATLPFNQGIGIDNSGGDFLTNLEVPSNGVVRYCKDCKNVPDDGATAGAVCAGSGSGALARRENSAWHCN